MAKAVPHAIATGLCLLGVVALVTGMVLMAQQVVHTDDTTGTGPGGVGSTDGSSGLKLWLKGDAGVSTSGGGVISWADQSGSGNDASGTGAVYFADHINGQSAVKFDGASVYSVGDLNIVNPYTIFTVCRQDGTIKQRLISSGSVNWLLGYWDGNEGQFYAGGWVHNPAASATGDTIIDSATGDGRTSIFYQNGQQLVSSNGDAAAAPGILQLGGTVIEGAVTEASDGTVAEVIVFNAILNTTQRTLMDNYLSAKYDVTLGCCDKYAGDTPGNGDYDLDVAGIGQESDGRHIQAHTAGLVLVGTKFLVDDGDYVLAGHRTSRNYLSSASLPGGVSQRWRRVWYLDRADGGSSAHGNMTLAFDFGEGKAGGTPANAGNYRLLFRRGTSGSFSMATVATTSIVDDQVVFEVAEVNLQDGYYTLGTTDTSVSPLGGVQLILIKAVDNIYPIPGERITYTLTVENSGLFDATGAVIFDTLPVGLTFAGPVTLEGSSGAVAEGVSDLPILASGLTITAGERITVAFPVTVNTGLANYTDLTNIAAITSAEMSIPQTGSNIIHVTEVVGVIRLNEILAANASANRDPDDYAFSDWIEIYNSGKHPVDLEGFYLTDDLSYPAKWRIPAGTIIEPGGFKLFWADGTDRTSDAYHTNFRLGRDGEEVGLFSPEEVLIDSIIYDSQVPDVSFGRQPDGNPNWFFFGDLTPNAPNNAQGCREKTIAPSPQFSLPGGFHRGNQVIELSTTSPSAVVRYTLDGSIPAIASTTYTSPIIVSSTTVIRARAFEAGYLPSSAIAHTYFIDEAYTLPVVSISTDPDNLWDGVTGIYSRHWEDLESPVGLEFYEPDGRLGFSLNAGAKMYGNYAKTLPQKSWAIFARNKYGIERVNYRIFDDKPVSGLKTFVLRNSGNDWRSTMFRDALMQALVRDQVDVDYLAYRPAIVFLNGEYWGIHNIREKINEHYPQSNYGMDPDNVDLVESHVNYDGHHIAQAGDIEHYNSLLDFVGSNDMALPENYDYVKTQMDVNEYLNYQISEIYASNTDWLRNNVKCWRPRTEGGKWRWIIYDADVAFGLDVSTYGWGDRDYTFNMIKVATDNDWWGSFLFSRLLKNPEFRNEFIQRFASHLNITFRPERVVQIIDSLRANIESEMPRHIEKWRIHCGGYEHTECGIRSMTAWESDINVMKDFANQRPAYVRQHIISGFGLTGTVELTLNNASGSGGGRILVNSVVVPDSSFAGIYFEGVPLRLEAIPNPGYRFVSWQGLPDGGSESVSVTLTKDATIAPIFEQVDSSEYPYPGEPQSLTSCTGLGIPDTGMQNHVQWSLTDAWSINEVNLLVMNEVYYNPSPPQDDDDYEFIELHNAQRSTVDLSGYYFSAGIEFTFPQATSISAGEYILIAKNADTYSDRGYQVFQWTSGGLKNRGEDIQLRDNAGIEIDYVDYDDGGDGSLWAVGPDGRGTSLALINPCLDNSLPENWRASYVVGGTPGQPNLGGNPPVSPTR